jgi:hypothetical protein
MFVCFLPTTPQIFSNIALMRTAQEGFCNKWWQVPRIGLNSKKAAQKNTTKPKSKWKCEKKFRSKCFSWNLVIFLSKKREYVACFLFYFLQLCEISHLKKGWFQHVPKNIKGCFIFWLSYLVSQIWLNLLVDWLLLLPHKKMEKTTIATYQKNSY